MQVISTLRGHDDKVRVVLNKADQVDQQQLMRVYGALMWSLSKVFRSPEVSSELQHAPCCAHVGCQHRFLLSLSGVCRATLATC